MNEYIRIFDYDLIQICQDNFGIYLFKIAHKFSDKSF
jgi:hypothetical protein